jgi:hypothetical protein
MELPGTTYLLALATVAITFVGFAALVLVLRQTIGENVTRYDTYFTLSFIQVGFIVTIGALLPPLLALYGWHEDVVWRSSSTVVAVLVLCFVVAVPRRRRVATGVSAPRFVWTLLAVQALSATALILCAAGALSQCGAVYASAMTTILFASGIAYLLALSVVIPEGRDKGRDAGQQRR